RVHERLDRADVGGRLRASGNGEAAARGGREGGPQGQSRQDRARHGARRQVRGDGAPPQRRRAANLDQPTGGGGASAAPLADRDRRRHPIRANAPSPASSCLNAPAICRAVDATSTQLTIKCTVLIKSLTPGL